METETGGQLAHHQGLPIPHHPTTTGLSKLEVVRALHQTVVSLRSALESSQEEIRVLKIQKRMYEDQQQEHKKDQQRAARHFDAAADSDLPLGAKNLSNSNDSSNQNSPDEAEHEAEPARRQRVVSRRTTTTSHSSTTIKKSVKTTTTTRIAYRKCIPETTVDGDSENKSTEYHLSRETPSANMSTEAKNDDPEKPEVGSDNPDGVAREGPETGEPAIPQEEAAASEKAPELVETPVPEVDEKTKSEGEELMTKYPELREIAQSCIVVSKIGGESENENEEVDNIELIFTTGEELRDVGLQEDLVSITAEHEARNAEGGAGTSGGSCGSAGSSNNGPEDGGKSGSIEEATNQSNSSKSSSLDREESVDRFDETSSGLRLNKMWSQCSVLVETDISKCGVVDEGAEMTAKQAARRNTLAAPVQIYRPIIHREAVPSARRKSLGTPLRPVMDNGPAGGPRRESSAQTDISALPAQWRSESYLAHKVNHSFTTLPSKFALPAGVSGRLRVSEKTREARRVMLSDYSFTSMVPELSRSADHLCQADQVHNEGCYLNARNGCCLRTPDSQRRECYARSGLPSPCECRISTEIYSTSTLGTGRCRNSLSSITSPNFDTLGSGGRRSGCWRPMAGSSLDTWRPPNQRSSKALATSCQSVPCSPTRLQQQREQQAGNLGTHHHGHHHHHHHHQSRAPRRTRSKVTFQDCPMIRGSLPNLRSELLMESVSGESTESLVDEAEEYLRGSIDSMLASAAESDTRFVYPAPLHYGRRRRTRRHSEPDLFREWNPPQDARPYLPKVPRDLKLDHLVKIISPEGRILQGRVRYVGPLAGQEDVHVGVELPDDNGNSDGTHHGTRFFDCEPEKAIFVPFKKVVLAWRTT